MASVCSLFAGEYSFLGAAILNEVMTDLVALHSLGAATDLFLAGSR